MFKNMSETNRGVPPQAHGMFKALGTRTGQHDRGPEDTTMNAMTPDGAPSLWAPLTTIPACQQRNGEVDWFPAVDILEDAAEYLFRVDLPEIQAEDICIGVDKDGLCISGERPKPGRENKTCLRVERPHGHFERRFALPDDASREEIESALADSLLEVRVRKVRALVQPPPSGTLPRLRLSTAL
jgi:HSP20 family protein